MGILLEMDPITASIWLVGFIIWVTWIIIPVKEFMGIFRSHKSKDD